MQLTWSVKGKRSGFREQRSKVEPQILNKHSLNRCDFVAVTDPEGLTEHSGCPVYHFRGCGASADYNQYSKLNYTVV